ncbi:MAG: hypothetical protein ACK52I_27195 [Pseudomonadota bacterium]
MRLLLVFALTAFTMVGFSQSPSSFKYQSVLRDKNSLLIVDKTVSVRISILQSKIDGATIYSETHSTKTSGSGIINLEIGKGVIVSGLFSSIAWGRNLHFVKIEMDPVGGNAFELVGVSQLLSVPYALFSQTSGDEKWDSVTGGINFKGGNVGIGNTTPIANIDIVGTGASNASVLTTRNNWSNSISNYTSGDQGFLQAGFLGFRSRGTWQSPTNIVAGDRIGSFGAAGYANGAYSTGAAMEMYTGNSLGTYLTFGTTSTPGATRTEQMRITENGNVGIGKTNPAYNLDVAGTINANSLLINGIPVVGSSPWNISGSNVSYSAGNVGIGTSSPTSNLEIIGSGSNNPNLLTTKNNSTNAISNYTSGDQGFLQAGFLAFRSRGTWQSPTTIVAGDRIGSFGAAGYANGAYSTGAAMEMYTGNSLGTYLIFGTTATPGATRTERMRISESGNVTVQTGDILINTINSGVIMKSPDGNCWRMTVNNAGAPVFASITCPL